MTPGAVIVILLLALCGWAGWAIARHEGHPFWGAVMGVVLGPVGVAVVAFSGWHARRHRRRLT